jgi:hypothetical protein
MLLCWRCNTRVRYVSDGWICPYCSQHGRPDLVARDWEEGARLNAPYRAEKDHPQS